LAWPLIEEARAAGIPLRVVVADSIDGENAAVEAQLFGAQIPSGRGLKPSHGTWEPVDGPDHPPAFTPAEATQRSSLETWQRTVRCDSHGQELVRSVAALELLTTDGPTTGVRLIAATRDPSRLKPESSWYLATSLPLAQLSAEPVGAISRVPDWTAH
jgi:hypothetical protein